MWNGTDTSKYDQFVNFGMKYETKVKEKLY